AMLQFFFSSGRRHTRSKRDWSSDVCSSDLRTGFIRKVLIPLKLPHSQTSVSLHSRMQIGVLHSTGKELVYSLFGQTGNGQIEFFLPTELHRVTAGKSLLLQDRPQVIQNFSITLLLGVPVRYAFGSS